MSNATASRPPLPTSWRGRTPGFYEFNLLLNQLADPAILVDNHRGQILLANAQFLQLTAFTQAEVISAELSSLMPEVTPGSLIPGEELSTPLNRHNRDALPVVARAAVMDNSNAWFLLIITPLSVYELNQTAQHRQEQITKASHELASLTQQPDLETSLELAMRIGRDLLGVPLLALYQANPQFPQLQKTTACEPPDAPFFPEILPSTDLIRMEAPLIWLPGKKVASELHRTARIANLSYMASIPLGQQGAWFGLLAAGDIRTQPPENLLSSMDILTANINATIQHFVLVTNLNSIAQKNSRSLLIQSAVIENAQEGLILLNPDLTILEMNPAAELILGYASSEVIGTSVDSILIGADTIPTALKSAQQGIPTHNLGNITLHRRRGQSFAAHVQTIPVFTSKELQSIVVFLSDVSENEQIRVRTQQLEQRAVLGEVTAIFAHEVRNPINNISTGLQFMGMNLPQSDPNQEAIGRMQHDCNRLTHLMESVLSFSRPQEYKFESTDLSLLLKRILERWEPRMARANVKSLFLPGNGLSPVNGDPRALEQVFTNLISNAVQAMSSTGGSLAIKIEEVHPPQEHPQVIVSITDSGPGIPDEIREHIFEPFVTTNPQGTGLGLAITKRIVTAHKGSVSVTSFPGGTMFQISLPAIIGDKT